MALLAFFQAMDPDTGRLVHDFTDPDWSTRFLGDLYQDLSEAARKRYALLQTPEFIEAFILERTLDPAIRESGFREVRMIDPACGSGHFLLGGFGRLLAEWQRHEPGRNPRDQEGARCDCRRRPQPVRHRDRALPAPAHGPQGVRHPEPQGRA
jgi:hypothetical protein